MNICVRALTIAIILAVGWCPAAAESPCLSRTEIHDVARMGSVMAIGGALRRCSVCLGDKYQATVDRYEASGLLVEFRRSEAALRTSQEKFEYADDLVRVAARKHASDLSADCNACKETAALIDELSSGEARSKLYDAEAGKIEKLPAYRRCP